MPVPELRAEVQTAGPEEVPETKGTPGSTHLLII